MESFYVISGEYGSTCWAEFPSDEDLLTWSTDGKLCGVARHRGLLK